MNKSLDALHRLYLTSNTKLPYCKSGECLDDYELVEKELKALEIIRRLPSDYVCDLLGVFRSFKDYTFGDFISWGGDETPILINEEEYNILRETLINE